MAILKVTRLGHPVIQDEHEEPRAKKRRPLEKVVQELSQLLAVQPQVLRSTLSIVPIVPAVPQVPAVGVPRVVQTVNDKSAEKTSGGLR